MLEEKFKELISIHDEAARLGNKRTLILNELNPLTEYVREAYIEIVDLKVEIDELLSQPISDFSVKEIKDLRTALKKFQNEVEVIEPQIASLSQALSKCEAELDEMNLKAHEAASLLGAMMSPSEALVVY